MQSSTENVRSQSSKAVLVATTGAWLVCSAPFVSGFLEFGETFWLFARGYPALFVFPVVALPFALFSLVRPFRAVRVELAARARRTSILGWLVLAVGVVLGPLVAIATELTKTHVTPWEVQEPRDSDTLKGFKTDAAVGFLGPDTASWIHEKKWPALFQYLLDTRSPVTQEPKKEDKTYEAFKAERASNQRLFAREFRNDLVASGQLKLSVTGWMRYASLGIATAVAFAHFAMALLLLVGRLSGKPERVLRAAFVHSTAGIMIFWFWVPLRVVTVETNRLLFSEDGLGGEGAVVFALTVASAIVLTFWLSRNRDLLLAILTFLTAAVGAFSFLFRGSVAAVLEQPPFYWGVTAVAAVLALTLLYFEDLREERPAVSPEQTP